jgi:hypothetical protein
MSVCVGVKNREMETERTVKKIYAILRNVENIRNMETAFLHNYFLAVSSLMAQADV